LKDGAVRGPRRGCNESRCGGSLGTPPGTTAKAGRGVDRKADQTYIYHLGLEVLRPPSFLKIEVFVRVGPKIPEALCPWGEGSK